MTNPLHQPGPADSRAAGSRAADPHMDDPHTGGTADAPIAAPATSARKAPRRSTAASGSPQRAAAPARLVLDAAGMIIPTKISALPRTHDAGAAPLSEPAPAAEALDGDIEPSMGDARALAMPAPVAAAGVEAAETEMADIEMDEVEMAGPEMPDSFIDEAVAEAAESTTAHVAPGGETATSVSMPRSRRERRLAEQKPGGAVVPDKETAPAGSLAPAATGRPAAVGTSRAVGPPSGRPQKKRNRLVATLRGVLFLVVISVMAVGTGTVLSGKNDPKTGPTKTEEHRQTAWANTLALEQHVAALGAAGEQPELAQLLKDTTADLAVQLSALGDGLPPSTASPTPSELALTPAGLDRVIADLQSNGAQLLDHALGADHAMGRVFAAAGTSQLLRGRALGAAAGMTPAGTPWLPATVDFPLPSGPECSSTLEPRPGATIDGALLAAADGEQKAIYAYQSTTPRLDDTHFSQAEELLARHQGKLTLLNAELQVRCLPRKLPSPGFALAPEFKADPEAALAGLEGQLASSYADLAALSTPPVAASTTEPTLGGAANGPAAQATPAATLANTSLLRQISVAWLLDTTHSQTLWGGILDPLPGLAAALVPTAL